MRRLHAAVFLTLCALAGLTTGAVTAPDAPPLATGPEDRPGSGKSAPSSTATSGAKDDADTPDTRKSRPPKNSEKTTEPDRTTSRDVTAGRGEIGDDSAGQEHATPSPAPPVTGLEPDPAPVETTPVPEAPATPEEPEAVDPDTDPITTPTPPCGPRGDECS